VVYLIYPYYTTPIVNQIDFVQWWQQFILTHHDGGHYLLMAQFGYNIPTIGVKALAFLPLFPFLIFLTNNLINNYYLSAIFLNIIFSTLSIFLLYKIVKKEFDYKVAYLTVFLFLIFPTTFFILMPYTESLFILLSLAAFYLLEKNKIGWAAVLGILLSLTRLLGLVICIPIFLHIVENYKLTKKSLYLLALVPLLGTLGYLGLNWMIGGYPLAFLTHQTHERWENSPQFIWDTFVILPFAAINTYNIGFEFVAARWGSLLIFLIVSFLTLIYGTLKKINLKYLLYCLVFIVITFSVSNPQSGMRFLMALWPLMMIQAVFFIKHKWLLILYVPLCIGLAILAWLFFVAGRATV
jgi:Gpi18-like mannosyltransferase